jgi:hypothetical protein
VRPKRERHRGRFHSTYITEARIPRIRLQHLRMMPLQVDAWRMQLAVGRQAAA